MLTVYRYTGRIYQPCRYHWHVGNHFTPTHYRSPFTQHSHLFGRLGANTAHG